MTRTILLLAMLMTAPNALASAQLDALAAKPESKPATKPVTDVVKPSKKKIVAAPVPKEKEKPPVGPPVPTVWERLETPVQVLRSKSTMFNDDRPALDKQDLDTLEGMANDAVLAVAVKTVLNETTKTRTWTQLRAPTIFPLEHVLANSALEVPTNFNPDGFRVAIFALQLGKSQRGIILTSSYQNANPGQLREEFKNNLLVRTLNKAIEEKDFERFAVSVAERLKTEDNRQSRHMPVMGVAQSWAVGCETKLAGSFCVNASMFDAAETNPDVLIEALSGPYKRKDLTLNPGNASVASEIRHLNLAWPISNAYVSRGFKFCGQCMSQHLGLDLTAPIGTPVHAVADGVVVHTKGFSGWGNAVVLEHKLPNGDKFISLYAHLSKFRSGLKPGDPVRRGEMIAESGRTGFAASTGASVPPHLHLEIRKAPDGKEPLQKPKTHDDLPLDPLRVMDVFNLFVGGETSATMPTPQAF